MKMVRVGDIWLVRHAQRIAALGATLLLAACAGTPYEAERPVPPAKPVPQAPAPRGEQPAQDQPRSQA